MKRKVGVRFKAVGKIYDFECGAFVLEKGSTVIVETEHGLGFGIVVTIPVAYEKDTVGPPLKKVCRTASEEDFRQRDKDIALEEESYYFCNEKIRELGLEMNLFSVESTFNSSKLTFFFTAEGRVDFRELVKILVKQYRIRIEMRQVGIRNQAKMAGGLGKCGREICCSSYLSKFEPVSIRMAKSQGLALNPTKISGLCGRLMCCLTFENDTYLDLKKRAPKIGKTVLVEGKEGKVARHNVICNRIAVRFEDGTEIEKRVDEVEIC
ncbi:MAG: stage 0 sporulation family protein [Deltaproteobacteria bacterium]|nr:stage 0 sporulation family protein [Deltaproteobacteria bacterium]MBW2219040.1 stage 0 sporulation family protein [Deltaproteobacteria bacterium]